MTENFLRTEMMFGKESIKKLNKKTVAIFGLGGVGGYVLEALVRGGIGNLELIDHDIISESNLNRQILATVNSIGKDKVDVAKERALSINPDIKICCRKEFLLPCNADKFDFKKFDYVVDAIDTVTAKLLLAEICYKYGTPIISVMGTGNKKNPTLFEISDIYKTTECPLARIMRKELKERNIPELKVVYSKEKAVKPLFDTDNSNLRPTVSSNSFVPAVAGLIAAGEVIKDLIN